MNSFKVITSECCVFFFANLQLSPECIQINHNNDGRPSGEALVAFQNRTEAERAIAEKNRHNIGARYIELFMT